MAAIVTWGNREKRSISTAWREASASASAGVMLPISAMSFPAQNARPRPLTTSTVTSSRAATSSSAPSMAEVSSRLSAFRAWGRLRRSQATPPLLSSSITSRGCLQEHSLEGLGYVDREEPASGITVVFSALVDDSEIPVPLRLLIRDDAIQLPDLERRLVALVLDANRKPHL